MKKLLDRKENVPDIYYSDTYEKQKLKSSK